MAAGPYGALLDAVGAVRWPARRRVPGGGPGAHQSRTRGVAPEFAEYRPYRQGDDPRRIDWKLLGRSDRAFIRLAPDHAILGTTFIVDASASMDFPRVTVAGEGHRASGKWELAKRLTIALAAVAHASGDPVGLTVISSQGTRRLDPRTRAGVVADIARTLDALVPDGSAPLAPLVAGAASRCVAITDCLGDLEALSAALARHRVRGGEAHLLHVVSHAELDPPSVAVTAVDPEDPRCERPLVVSTRAGYRESFAAWRAEVSRRALADGIAYHEVHDDALPEVLVRRIVVPPGGEWRR